MLAVLVFGSLLASRPAMVRAADQIWLVASDIHLNPFDHDPEPVDFGSDTNVALFDSMVREMHAAVPSPTLVLLPGDFLVHDFTHRAEAHPSQGTPVQIAEATMRTIASALDRIYPKARFEIALGNNDAPCGDYRSDQGDAYLAALARIWGPLVDRGGAAPSFVRQFSRGGYYESSLPVRGFRLISLQTVALSIEYRGECGGGRVDVTGTQLAWVRATLARTPKDTRNVLMMHIPPGYDAMVTETAHGFLPWSFLHAGANAELLHVLTEPAYRVAYAFSGHLHRFDFRLAGNVPIITFGSISPVYHNDPAFYAVRVAPDGSLRDIDTYVYDEWTGQWVGPRSFDREFGVASIDAPSLAALHQRLGTDPALRKEWNLSTTGWPSRHDAMWGSWARSWRVAWCAQSIVTRSSGFAECAGIERRVVFLRIVLAGLAFAVLAAIAAVVVSVRRRRGRSRPSLP
ncbi:MAG TPA: metallophosphoesterase [Candidatus Acidoferrales bacterium]|nr:metallophosphoesterase [Candidatus Acidoferrales bacterium]